MDREIIWHKELAESSRWEEMPFAQQMANVGSEVFRALKWKEKGKPERAELAADRALELLDFTIRCAQQSKKKLKELLRLREILCDYFYGENDYGSTQENLNKYFYALELETANQRYN
jgi:hypothetical protein